MNMTARSVAEWTSTNPDATIPARVKVRIVERHDGRCAKCTRRLVPGQFAFDHIVALVNGGTHSESNLQPLCASPCHLEKTKTDVATKSKTYERRAKHIGVKRRRRTIPGKRFNGTAIPSRWVE